MLLKVYVRSISSKIKNPFFCGANFIKDLTPVKFLQFSCYWTANLSIPGPPCVDSRDRTQAHASSPLVSIICRSRPWGAYWMRRWLKQISTNHIRRVEEAETFGNLQLLEWAKPGDACRSLQSVWDWDFWRRSRSYAGKKKKGCFKFTGKFSIL